MQNWMQQLLGLQQRGSFVCELSVAQGCCGHCRCAQAEKTLFRAYWLTLAARMHCGGWNLIWESTRPNGAGVFLVVRPGRTSS